MNKEKACLNEAIQIAIQGHAKQADKAGNPYVLHPLRLMMRMTTEEEKIAAVLHDVVEDTEWTIAALRDTGFSEGVLTAVGCLTKLEGETYNDFIRRAGQNPIAKRVKIADLEDNMDVKRLVSIEDRDVERLRKYHAAWKFLTES